MSPLLTLDDLGEIRGKTVFLRVDFNVPLEEGKVLDDTRLQEALPTIQELLGGGATVVAASHCGRPKGKPEPRYSLQPVAVRLGELLGAEVAFAPDCVGEKAEGVVAALAPGAICLLENLRYHPGETENDPDFARQLASLADTYVNDAFGAAHRAHASVVGVAGELPQKAAGRLVVREVEALGRLLEEPEQPFAAVLGGAKVEGKIDTLRNLLPRLDLLLLGGGMANTFLAAQGHDLADSLVEAERLHLAREILREAHEGEVRLLLPSDLVVTDNADSPAEIQEFGVENIPPHRKAVDIGQRTQRAFWDALAGAATVFWNGPMGIFEKRPFDAGTRTVAAAVAGCDGFTVIGGGETVAAARQAGVLEGISHVSTGGGAALEFLAGKTLPGIAALEAS